jgi:predicted transport protein
LHQFFQCYFLKNFYKIQGGEIDTLAVTEDGIPCIIEYKHRKEDTILNQVVFYYDWLMQRSTKFEFERIVKENEKTKSIQVDWSKIRLICIAKEYSKWDMSLIKHLDTNIECWAYSYHKDELDLHLDPIINQYKKEKVYERSNSSSVKEVTLEDHRNKADEDGKALLDKLREEIFELGDDINEGFTPNYIKYYVNTTFLGLHVRKKHLVMQLRVDEDKFKDPQKMAKDISNRNWTVTREVRLSNSEEMPYILSLIKQAYESQK